MGGLCRKTNSNGQWPLSRGHCGWLVGAARTINGLQWLFLWPWFLAVVVRLTLVLFELRPALTVYAHADEDTLFSYLRSRVRLCEPNFLSLSSMETPRTKMPTSLELPPN